MLPSLAIAAKAPAMATPMARQTSLSATMGQCVAKRQTPVAPISTPASMVPRSRSLKPGPMAMGWGLYSFREGRQRTPYGHGDDCARCPRRRCVERGWCHWLSTDPAGV